MVKDLTKGKPFGLILGLSLSFIIGNVFQYFYSTVDALVVGRVLGADALAAVGATGSLTFLILGFSQGIAGGFGVVVGQYFGAKNDEELKCAVTHVVYLSAILMAILTPLSCVFCRPMLKLLNTPDNIIDMSCDYLVVLFGGMVFSLAYNAISSIMRALGDGKTPLYILIFTCILNTGLDIALVAWWKAGVAGAAYATVIAQAVSSLLSLLIMWKRMPVVRPARASFRYSARMIRRLLTIGAPMGFQMSITAIGTIPVAFVLNGYGSAVIAAMTAIDKVTNIFMSLLASIGTAVTFFCAQNIGAGEFDRMKRGVWIASGMELVISAATVLICLPFGVSLASFFLGGEVSAEIADLMQDVFLAQTLLYPMLGVIFVFRGAIQGAGYSAPTMIGGGLELVARTMAVLVGQGIFWVYFSHPLAWVTAALFYLPAFFIILARVKKRIGAQPSQS